LLSLLEKYDTKLDELQEDIEMRDLKIIEYEKDFTSSKDRIKIDNMDDKIKFITTMLEKLKHMHHAHKSSEKKA
jgi:ppGpp synthetase/RelA/SpoT-type nucleotidyltranferase